MGDLTLRQRHPRSCGATCLAFVAGISLDEAESINGRHGTNTQKLVRSLRTLGFQSGGILERITPRCQPQPGDIVKIRWNFTQSWHWVVKLESGYYDPLHGETTDAYYQKRRGHATSFLSIWPAQAHRQAA